ncbi:MAG: hypothetical protein H0V44_17615 [Planctomycetes bacterium]|nr:hypothetical protein [Planctomycetota bacterium]
MSHPLLLLNHDWHSQRAKLRQGRVRPPPLVAAGVDVVFDADKGREVKLGGLAVIFGTFPATVDEFVALARARLHLGPDQARELDPVLNTRVLAMWAWLPTLRQDCYLEFDRATGAEQVWLIGPGPGEAREVDIESPDVDLDHAFLEALVLNGPGHWGGESGLQRLVRRFGRQPLLIAAQVADLLEHRPREPRKALRVAQALWADLGSDDENAWAALAGSEHPWVCVQLGRLALRLGLLRAARLLLGSTHGTGDAAPIAHFDLGQACEALDDLPAAEAAFARFASARPSDPDAWRRLLFCRLRMGHLHIAEETLRRYRSASGKDDDLAERYLSVVARGRVRGEQRATLAGWLGARLHETLIGHTCPDALVEEIARLCFDDDDTALAAAIRRGRIELVQLLAAGPDPLAAEANAEALLRTALLALPFLGGMHREEVEGGSEACATNMVAALHLWSDLRLSGTLRVLPSMRWVRELAALAMSARRQR